MKKLLSGLALLSILAFPLAGICGEFDRFLADMNVQAGVDLPGFKARLSATFGVPVPRVDAIVAAVHAPADAYMVLKVGQVARQPEEVVLREYQSNKGKGWGVIAKNLGIKPGSREFHELKKGLGDGGSGKVKGKDKAKGKGKHGR